VSIVNSAIGNASCKGRSACTRLQNAVIGDGSCNCDDCCENLPAGCAIPDGECNDQAQGCSDTCPNFGSRSCQNFESNDATLSDGSMSRIADNFIPDSNDSISKVQFYGAYVVDGKPVDGSATPKDAFQLTYYEDDGNGLPGRVIGGPFVQNDEDVPLTVTVPEGTDEVIAEAATMYKYEATHAAVPVTASAQYWIEIVNKSDDKSQWFWAPSLDGDLRAVVDGPPLNGYDSSDVKEVNDFAFCFNIPFSSMGRRRLDKKEVGTKNSLSFYLNA